MGEYEEGRGACLNWGCSSGDSDGFDGVVLGLNTQNGPFDVHFGPLSKELGPFGSYLGPLPSLFGPFKKEYPNLCRI